LRPGAVVIVDNLGSHKGRAVRDAIRAAGAKLKHLLRKADARNFDTVTTAIGQLLGSFTPQECVNYFRNSGFERA
jgi:hypothetical protein